MKWYQEITEERLEILREKVRNDDLKIEDFPYIEVPVRVYLRNPVDMGDGTRKGFLEFRNAGAEVLYGDTEVGSISSSLGVGNPILKFLDIEGEFIISAPNLWKQLKDLLELDYSEYETEEEDEEPHTHDQSCLNTDSDCDLDQPHKDDELEQLPPDWEDRGYIRGGYFSQIPEPHVWYYPHPEGKKRELHARIMRHDYGGGVHWYVSIVQEDNKVWYNGRWRECWSKIEDKFPGEGKTIHNSKYRLHHKALDYVHQVHQEQFPDHELILDDWREETDEDFNVDGSYYIGKHGE